MPDKYICTNVYYITKTLVNRAYVGQATLKDNEAVKQFRAYDGIHLQCMDKKLVCICL